MRFTLTLLIFLALPFGVTVKAEVVILSAVAETTKVQMDSNLILAPNPHGGGLYWVHRDSVWKPVWLSPYDRQILRDLIARERMRLIPPSDTIGHQELDTIPTGDSVLTCFETTDFRIGVMEEQWLREFIRKQMEE